MRNLDIALSNHNRDTGRRPCLNPDFALNASGFLILREDLPASRIATKRRSVIY